VEREHDAVRVLEAQRDAQRPGHRGPMDGQPGPTPHRGSGQRPGGAGGQARSVVVGGHGRTSDSGISLGRVPATPSSQEQLSTVLDFVRGTHQMLPGEVREIPEGWVVRSPSWPGVWMLNHVRVATEVTY